jgi:hypothetical protein
MFESDVRRFSDDLFKRNCSSCITPCCKPEVCYESIESPFLARIRNIFPSPVAFSEIDGWLTESGCALQAGRPPVCHEFLCTAIIDGQPTPHHKTAIKVLSKLVSYIGKNALGNQHLVEIMVEGRFQKMNLSRLQHRLTDARLAFKEIKELYSNPLPNSKTFVHLRKIRPIYSEKRSPFNRMSDKKEQLFGFPSKFRSQKVSHYKNKSQNLE